MNQKKQELEVKETGQKLSISTEAANTCQVRKNVRNQLKDGTFLIYECSQQYLAVTE